MPSELTSIILWAFKCASKDVVSLKLALPFKLMKYLLTLFLMATFASAGQAQKNNPEHVVQTQLEAYNARDIDAFMATFDSTASLWNFGETEPIASGADALRTIYQRVFDQSPNLHSTVINRTVIGSKVIDYEVIVGRTSGDTTPLHLVMIYEVKNGKIIKAVALRND